jgi:digalactosyldiacylglycerol synthase
VPWCLEILAVNPLLRSAYLLRRYQQIYCRCSENGDAGSASLGNTYSGAASASVTLVIPWLESSQDRAELYGLDWEYATMEHQREYIRNWLRDSANMSDVAGSLCIEFYPARYHAGLSSIFAMGDFCDRLNVPIALNTLASSEAVVNGVSDTTKVAEDEANQEIDNCREADSAASDAVCILEEPEHVNFYRAPGRRGWRQKFSHVVGIVHTNYQAYAAHKSPFPGSLVVAPLVGAISAWMVRAYCDKVIKLSDVLQEYAPEKEIVCNVHGIRSDFLSLPLPTPTNAPDVIAWTNQSSNRACVYYIGKLLWAKGLDRILELEMIFQRSTGMFFPIDIYGSGPDEDEIQLAFLGRSLKDDNDAADSTSFTTTEANREEMNCAGLKCTFGAANKGHTARRPVSWNGTRGSLPARFMGRKDHAQVGWQNYNIFFNPSVTEVLCTTTAEALAMTKFVIIPKHPSNEFFENFPNCLSFETNEEFISKLQFAFNHDPVALTEDLKHSLTWEAATERFLESAAVSLRDAARRDRVGRKWDDRATTAHYALGNGRTGDVLRKVLGGGPVADQFQYQRSQRCSLNRDR